MFNGFNGKGYILYYSVGLVVNAEVELSWLMVRVVILLTGFNGYCSRDERV